MNTMIKLERDGSIEHRLTRDDKGLLDLTFRNVCIVEAMIHENRAYSRAQNMNAGPKGKYRGSSAYLFDQLIRGKVAVDKKFCTTLVAALDSENSTHLSSRKTVKGEQSGRGIMTERVFELLREFEEFKELLRNGDTSLIQKLACPDRKYAGRELAFASKFCHYAAFWFFAGKKAADQYSIFDSIVSKALVDYAKRYIGNDYPEIKDFENELKKYHSKCKTDNWKKYSYGKFYKKYQDLIDATRKSACKIHKEDEPISRNGFDHLLWYAS